MWKIIISLYRKLAAAIVEIDDRVTVSLLCSSLSGDIKKYQNYLMHTCKTHKDFGKWAFRPAHLLFIHAFTRLMSWVSLVLQDALSKWKHLCGSTDGFLKRIPSFKMDEDDVIMHMDLKDFVMTGTAEFLTHHRYWCR